MHLQELLPLAAACLLSLPASAIAYDKGDWVLRFGAASVDPKSDNGSLTADNLDLSIDDNVKPTIALSYFFAERFAAQLLAAVPFEHDFNLADGAVPGSLKHLPPTLTLQYHFNPKGPFNAYVGAGVNYTLIYDEEIAIPGADLSIDNSFGLAAEGGIEYQFSENWSFGAQVWWIDIDADVELDGVFIGEAEVDPWVYGLSFSYRF